MKHMILSFKMKGIVITGGYPYDLCRERIFMITGHIVDVDGPVTFGVSQFSLTVCVVYMCICICICCMCVLCICKYVDDEQVQVACAND